MKKLLSLLILILLVLGCAPKEKSYKDSYKFDAPPPEKKRTEPEIGMNIVEFTQMCGKRGKRQRTETASGTHDGYVYEEKDKPECNGRFYFDNNILTMISR
jgi:hypothetical protein